MPLGRGATLGPYQVLSLLGEGGMGEVYRARDPRLGRDVAIKVLPAAFSQDPDRLRRFEQEARAASALNHPGILVAYDVGTSGGMAYLVSELLEGQSLRDRMSGVPMPPGKIVDFALQTAQALAVAHDKGIVHRDLKPENLFVTADGRVKILDFGLAKLSPQAGAAEATELPTAEMTAAGTILGTVGYMSPEQVAGQPVDIRADQFSFGAVFYEAATGTRAFQGATAVETLSAILRHEPAPVATLNPQMPAPFCWLLDRCLAKDPADRFASTRDLAHDLESIKNHLSEFGRSGEAATAAPAAAAAIWRYPFLAAGLAAGLLAGVVIGLWWSRSRPVETPELRYLTFSGHDSSPTASPDGRIIAFSSDRDGRRRIWLKTLAEGSEAPLTSGGPDDFPRFSPDGAMVLFSRGDGEHRALYKVATVGGEPRKLVDDAADGDWSPDGSQVSFARFTTRDGKTSTALGLVGADGRNQHEITQAEGKIVWHPRFSPDGRTIAAMEQSVGTGIPSAIFLVGADGRGARVISAPPGGFAISSLAWSAGTDEIVYSQSESVQGTGTAAAGGTARLVRQNVKTGASEILFKSPQNSATLDIVGHGRVVFDTGSPRQSLREFSLGTSDATSYRWLTRGTSQDRQPTYAPDIEWVLFSSNRGGNLDLWALSTTSGALRRVTDDPADDWDPAFTADGKRILWSSNRSGHLEIWMAAADGSDARQVTSDGVDAENPTATPDGRWIVYTSKNPDKRGVWKIRDDGSGATRLVAGDTRATDVSPDGQYALYLYLPVGTGPLHVVRIADGVVVPFEIRGATRGRWLPGSRAIAFLARDDAGVPGLFAQDFSPGQDTRATRQRLGGFDAELPTETFGISPDGTRIAISSREPLFSLMIAERVPGITRPAPPGR